ncbi:hypothetical protein K9L67_05435 [Candidatus Woesearchaeota archaeon]|nr:hypothetical protein [Candidatus Woesearchaeota archaeon]MCF7901641.1 hypothetical protein [Candidatus Woesearchaeota archaeon]MCF8013259.1 hypothetical protein [Candidatus Woesearchaeota archaeon]
MGKFFKLDIESILSSDLESSLTETTKIFFPTLKYVVETGGESQIENFIETANSYVDDISEVKSEDFIIHTKKQDLIYVFSSRGSLPFNKGIHSAITNHFDSNLTYKFIPHIFSTENLLDILDAGGKLNRKSLGENIFEIFYEDIAKKLSDKLTHFIPKSGRARITDWDEVITGNNLSHRIKIYNKLNFDENVPFHIISVLNKSGKTLLQRKKKEIGRNLKESKNNLFHRYVNFDGEISWSDNDVFFDAVGMEYPGAMAPDSNFVQSSIKKELRPDFYFNYLNTYNRIISGMIGFEGKSLKYKLLRKSKYDLKADEVMVYTASLHALNLTVNKFNISDNLNIDTMKIDYETEKIFWNKGKKTVPVLNRFYYDGNKKVEFLNPFVLIYDNKKKESSELNQIFEEYLSNIKEKYDEFLISTNTVYE